MTQNVLKLAVFAKLHQNNLLAETFSGKTNTRKQERFSANKNWLCPLDLIKYFSRNYWVSNVYLWFWAMSRQLFLGKWRKTPEKTTKNLFLVVRPGSQQWTYWVFLAFIKRWEKFPFRHKGCVVYANASEKLGPLLEPKNSENKKFWILVAQLNPQFQMDPQ